MSKLSTHNCSSLWIDASLSDAGAKWIIVKIVIIIIHSSESDWPCACNECTRLLIIEWWQLKKVTLRFWKGPYQCQESCENTGVSWLSSTIRTGLCQELWIKHVGPWKTWLQLSLFYLPIVSKNLYGASQRVKDSLMDNWIISKVELARNAYD